MIAIYRHLSCPITVVDALGITVIDVLGITVIDVLGITVIDVLRIQALRIWQYIQWNHPMAKVIAFKIATAPN